MHRLFPALVGALIATALALAACSLLGIFFDLLAVPTATTNAVTVWSWLSNGAVLFYVFQQVPLELLTSSAVPGGESAVLAPAPLGGLAIVGFAIALGGFVAAKLASGTDRERVAAAAYLAVFFAALSSIAAAALSLRFSAAGFSISVVPSSQAALLMPFVWGLLFATLGALTAVKGQWWSAITRPRLALWSASLRATVGPIGTGCVLAGAIVVITLSFFALTHFGVMANVKDAAGILLSALLFLPNILGAAFLASMGLPFNWDIDVLVSSSGTAGIFAGVIPTVAGTSTVPVYARVAAVIPLLVTLRIGYSAARYAIGGIWQRLRAALLSAALFTVVCWLLAALVTGQLRLGALLGAGVSVPLLPAVLLPAAWAIAGGLLGALVYIAIQVVSPQRSFRSPTDAHAVGHQGGFPKRLRGFLTPSVARGKDLRDPSTSMSQEATVRSALGLPTLARSLLRRHSLHPFAASFTVLLALVLVGTSVIAGNGGAKQSYRANTQPLNAAGLKRLQDDAGGPKAITVMQNQLNASPSFIHGRLPLKAAKADPTDSAADKAMAVVERYADLFGIEGASNTLRHNETRKERSGSAHVYFDQLYSGVEVEKGTVSVHFDRSGSQVSAISNQLVPDIHLKSVKPALSAKKATQVAKAALAKASLVGKPRLSIYTSRLTKKHSPLLAWIVNLSNSRAKGSGTYIVDAQKGEIVDVIENSRHLLNRKSYSVDNTDQLPGRLLRSGDDWDVKVGLSDGGRFANPSSWGRWTPFYTPTYADVTGDGAADQIEVKTEKRATGDVQVSRSEDGEFERSVDWGQVSYADSYYADVNADRKADQIGRAPSGNVRVGLSSGYQFRDATKWGDLSPDYDAYYADVNGDGKADQIGHHRSSGNVYVSLSDGASFGSSNNWGGYLSPEYEPYYADVNGGGKADQIGRHRSSGDVRVRLSNGYWFGLSNDWGYLSPEYEAYYADVDGDSKADQIGRHRSSGDVQVSLSDGASFGSSTDWGDLSPDYGAYYADVNADRKADQIGRKVAPVPPSGDRDADEAWDNAGEAWDYFWTTFKRDNFDGRTDEPWRAATHYSSNYQDSFWEWGPDTDGDHVPESWAMFGDGMAKLDIVTHEWSHAVIEFTSAQLENYWQSGALAESFADFFAAMADRDDWQIGEDTPGGPLRDMSNPTAYGQPDHVDGWSITCTDNYGIHTNSGITNKAFYNIATAIGKEKTEQLLYFSLTTFMAPQTTLEEAREMILFSALVLEYSPEDYTAIEDSFNAVGLDGVWEPPGPPEDTCVDCAPASALEGSELKKAGPGALKIVATLYRARSELASKSPAGNYYMPKYQRYLGRIAAILARDRQLRATAGRLLQEVTPGLEKLMNGDGDQVRVTQKLHRQVEQAFLRGFSYLDMSSSKDKKLLELVLNEYLATDPEHFVGMTFEDAWDDLNKNVSKQQSQGEVKDEDLRKRAQHLLERAKPGPATPTVGSGGVSDGKELLVPAPVYKQARKLVERMLDEERVQLRRSLPSGLRSE